MLSDNRRRRLWKRVEESCDTNPVMALEGIELLLLEQPDSRKLLLFKARALSRLERSNEAAKCWRPLLEGDDTLALEALPVFLASFDYAAIKTALATLQADLPEVEDALVLCIRAAQAVRQSGLALELCERLVGLAPQSPVHRTKLGSLYQSFGRMEDAENAFRAALKTDPDFQPAWYFLAQLRKWEPDCNHSGELGDFLEHHGSSAIDTSATHYALAKELEDLALYDDAFEHLEAGAAQVRSRSHYHIDQDRKLFAELQDWFVRSGEAHCEGLSEEGPVFILGMPRTGSTLADRILSSHSEVESVGELMCFKRAVEELCGGQNQPDFFASFFSQAPGQLPYADIGRRYLEMLSPLTGESRYFIDKMPMNYAFVGLIARALPRARFIHTVRNPMDTCFSNYKQMFGEGYYGYSYDLEQLAAHYKLYRELMAFWRRQIPGRIYDLHYEELVTNTESEVRQLLNWLDLEWQPDCLAFHRNSGAVNTASVSQVRQPIYRGSVEKWRKFEPHLGSLKTSLGKLQDS